MGLNEQFLYDTFNLYYKKGMSAYKQGNYAFARRNILQASEILLKLAKSSSGELQKSRVERANRLIEMAKDIEENGANARVFGNAGAKVESGGTVTGNKAVKAQPKPQQEEDEDKPKFSAATVPDIGFDDVAGLYEVKKSIQTRIILPLKNPDVYSKYKKKTGGGILLYGPPGTGKTMIAKAIGHEVGAKFYSVKCSDIVSKWFGEAEKNIKNLFETARTDERAIIFFDEIEALGTKRGGDSSVMNRIVPELLAQMQGFEEYKSSILILGATNRPWDMDKALLRSGRFDEVLYIPMPDKAARMFIIDKALEGVPMDNDISIDWLGDMTEGYSGAEIDEFCDRAKEDPLLRAIEDEKIYNLTREDFINAGKRVRRSVTIKDLKEYDDFINGKL
jgi:transitional endoplasmic reticulum ATPase